MKQTLRQQWDELNQERANRQFQPYSYSFLADCAGSAEAVPGEPVQVSKSTVAAIMAGRYKTTTTPAIIKRLEEVIRMKLSDLGIATPAPAKPRRAAKPKAVVIKRCSPEGYIKVGREHYYLGQVFRGALCTVHQHRDKDKTISVTAKIMPSMTARRQATPVDPANNQLGYEGK